MCAPATASGEISPRSRSASGNSAVRPDNVNVLPSTLLSFQPSSPASCWGCGWRRPPAHTRGVGWPLRGDPSCHRHLDALVINCFAGAWRVEGLQEKFLLENLPLFFPIPPSLQHFIQPPTLIRLSKRSRRHPIIHSSTYPSKGYPHTCPAICLPPTLSSTLPTLHSFIHTYLFTCHPSLQSFSLSSLLRYPSIHPSLHSCLVSSSSILSSLPCLIYPFILSSLPLFVHPFILPSITSLHSFVPTSLHSCFHHPSIHSSIHPTLHYIIPPSIHPSFPPSICSLVHLFLHYIPSCLCSFMPTSIHSSFHPLPFIHAFTLPSLHSSSFHSFVVPSLSVFLHPFLPPFMYHSRPHLLPFLSSFLLSGKYSAGTS